MFEYRLLQRYTAIGSSIGLKIRLLHVAHLWKMSKNFCESLEIQVKR